MKRLSTAASHLPVRQIRFGTIMIALYLSFVCSAVSAFAADAVSPNPVPVISGPSETSGTSMVYPPDKCDRGYIAGYFSDTGRMLTSPASWDAGDWLSAGLVTGATAGLFLLDADVRDISQRNQSTAGNRIASVGNALGNPLYTVPPLGLFYLYGHINEDPKARRAALLAVESLAISGVFTWTVKMAAQRPRPFTGESPATWNGPGLNSTNPAFPSGHTQSAFSIASVLAEEYGDSAIVAPLAYTLATLTGVSRIYDDKHWVSDVFFGGAIGYYVGKAVVRYHSGSDRSAVRILPSFSQNSFGVIAEYRF